MKKRLLSLILVFAMVFGMMPTMALAGDQMEDTVYISASRDGEYLAFDNGYLAYMPVKLSDLAEIDLETYGLSEYAYDVDGDGANEITAVYMKNSYYDGGSGAITAHQFEIDVYASMETELNENV